MVEKITPFSMLGDFSASLKTSAFCFPALYFLLAELKFLLLHEERLAFCVLLIKEAFFYALFPFYLLLFYRSELLDQ
jgi:hypothetical protein